ncbi:unnamed protein product [[Actinomadura] parvosata subsp. kistnae]|nr:unnamed protein product [Actinomadura parvosata subsp. kistnae]
MRWWLPTLSSIVTMNDTAATLAKSPWNGCAPVSLSCSVITGACQRKKL